MGIYYYTFYTSTIFIRIAFGPLGQIKFVVEAAIFFILGDFNKIQFQEKMSVYPSVPRLKTPIISQHSEFGTTPQMAAMRIMPLFPCIGFEYFVWTTLESSHISLALPRPTYV